MVNLLFGVALITGLLGLVSLSNATAGIGGIAFGCLLAILARLIQAQRHHAQLMTVPQQHQHRPSSDGPASS